MSTEILVCVLCRPPEKPRDQRRTGAGLRRAAPGQQRRLHGPGDATLATRASDHACSPRTVNLTLETRFQP